MEFSERVLVLQVGKFRESDLWVRFLSPSRGLVSAFAFGGSRSRRRFVGCLDIFNEISVRISTSNRTPYLALQEGVLLKGVSRLRQDWSRFGIAANCVRFLQSFDIGAEGAEEALFLMREVLLLLENEKALPRLLPLFFRLRLAFDQGYAMELSHCSFCATSFKNAPDPNFLFLREGRIVCRACAQNRPEYRLALGGGTLKALEQIKILSPSCWNQITLPPEHSREFARAVDGFIEYHVGIAWDRGRFVRR